jgi:hypothetical protein
MKSGSEVYPMPLASTGGLGNWVPYDVACLSPTRKALVRLNPLRAVLSKYEVETLVFGMKPNPLAI